MILTFPNFGYSALVISKIFGELGIDFVLPQKNNKHILKMGSEKAPEDMCVPFKYMVGNLMDAYGRGADTVLMMATAGPCRLGEYGQLLKEILDRSGYAMDWILIDAPSVIGKKEFISRVKKVTDLSEKSRRYMAGAVLKNLILVKKLDALRHKAAWTAGYLEKPYKAAGILRETETKVYNSSSWAECMKIMGNSEKTLTGFKRKHNANPVKILIAGEIYTSMESDSNGYLEEMLMCMGCSVRMHASLTWWVEHTLLNMAVPSQLISLIWCREGMKYNVGGYSRETVNKILHSRKFDGVIKVMPSGCMPEIVAKSYCENIQKKKDYKILYLVYDEMSENTGYETRVEAFTDMLERRKHVLAGDRHRLHKHGSGIDG